MEFQDVVRRRKMVRNYATRPVDPELVDLALHNATRAPNAGFSQGWAFLVLDTPQDVRRFWEVTADPDDLAEPGRWLTGMMRAPVVILPCSSKAAYLRRYAEPDKGWTDGDEARWPKPFWDMDAAMASLLILQTATDHGLASCFIGVPPSAEPGVRAAFDIPDDFDPIGVVTLGHHPDVTGGTGGTGGPDPLGAGSPGSPARRRRKPLDEVVHRGRWRSGSDEGHGPSPSA